MNEQLSEKLKIEHRSNQLFLNLITISYFISLILIVYAMSSGRFYFLIIAIVFLIFTNRCINKFKKPGSEINPFLDERPPFLFLRSFSQQELTIRPIRKGEVHSGPSILKTLDSNLFLHGRVLILRQEITIDFDEDDLITINENDKQWFETFHFLAESCRAIFIIPSISKGLITEIKAIIANNYMDKTLVLMPPISPLFVFRQGEELQFESGWRLAQKELNKQLGLNLPDYDRQGMLYLPHPDFSIKKSYRLNRKLRNINLAVTYLIGKSQSTRLSLKQILETLKQSGFNWENYATNTLAQFPIGEEKKRLSGQIDSMLTIAHRGASFEAPENTLAAVRLAWERFADAVEIDVQLSRDMQIVVIHDYNTWRTARKFRQVKKQSLKQLKKLDVGKFKGRYWTNERIPTLAEVIKIVPSDKILFIEIKCGIAVIPELKRILQHSRLQPQQVKLIGFDLKTMAVIKQNLPNHDVIWVNELQWDQKEKRMKPDVNEMVQHLQHHHLDGLSIWPSSVIDAQFMATIKAANTKLFAWTINDPVEAERLRSLGIDGITTDRPRWIKMKLWELKSCQQ